MFLTTKYEQIVKLEHLLCPKVGGAQTHLCPPTFESGEARAPPAPPSPTPLHLNCLTLEWNHGWDTQPPPPPPSFPIFLSSASFVNLCIFFSNVEVTNSKTPHIKTLHNTQPDSRKITYLFLFQILHRCDSRPIFLGIHRGNSPRFRLVRHAC